jgi:hypothetical protein
MGFVEQIAKRHPSCLQVVFTGFPGVEPSYKAGEVNVPYWTKSPTGVDKENRRIPEYSARGWAMAVRKTLEQDWIRNILERGGDLMPPGACTHATLSERYFGQVDGSSAYIAHILDLWESLLFLHWSLALALARHAGVAPPLKSFSGKIEEVERGLEILWPPLAERKWLEPLRPYIGIGNKLSGAGAGARFLDNASKRLRQLRNERAHSFQREDWSIEEFEDPIRYLLDATAFWMDHPLLSRLVLRDSESGVVRAEVLRGDYPWKQQQDRRTGAKLTRSPTSEHVHMEWRGPDGRPLLIDLWPFVTLARDPQMGHRNLCTASHLYQGTWWRRSLSTGRKMPWDLHKDGGHEATRLLEDMLPRSRVPRHLQ